MRVRGRQAACGEAGARGCAVADPQHAARRAEEIQCAGEVRGATGSITAQRRVAGRRIHRRAERQARGNGRPVAACAGGNPEEEVAAAAEAGASAAAGPRQAARQQVTVRGCSKTVQAARCIQQAGAGKRRRIYTRCAAQW